METEEQQEAAFEHLVSNLSPELMNTPAYKKIIHDLENVEGDYGAAIEKVEALVEKFDAAHDRIAVKWSNPEFESKKEDMERIKHEMMSCIDRPDGELGQGATAEVYTFSTRKHETLCIKWIKHEDKYKELIGAGLGITIEREADMLQKLSDLEVAGVRVPKPLFAFEMAGTRGIVMEQLDAVTFSRVLEGIPNAQGERDELPDGFDVNKFFSQVHQFVKEMHKRGIYHGDLWLRNLMIDRNTGDPYVIDFGKGRYDWELDKTKADPEDYAEKDFQALQTEKNRVVQWLREQGPEGLDK